MPNPRISAPGVTWTQIIPRQVFEQSEEGCEWPAFSDLLSVPHHGATVGEAFAGQALVATRNALELFAQKTALEKRLALLELKVQQLTTALEDSDNLGPSIVVPIDDLDSHHSLQKPIYAVVEKSGEEFVATFYDANVNATGETVGDAVWNLKEMLVLTFQKLCGRSNLGPALARKAKVLESLVLPK